MHQSPDYILEKYVHWIGFEPVTDYPHYTPDELSNFFNQYHKLWGDDLFKVKRQLLYLIETENLQLIKIVNSFERYFGPIEMLSSEKKTGLHHTLFEFGEEILLGNSVCLKNVLRDLRLKELL